MAVFIILEIYFTTTYYIFHFENNSLIAKVFRYCLIKYLFIFLFIFKKVYSIIFFIILVNVFFIQPFIMIFFFKILYGGYPMNVKFYYSIVR